MSAASPAGKYGELRRPNTQRPAGAAVSTTLEALQAEVLRLSPKDRARLLDRPIASLDADAEGEASWDALAGAREEELEAGTVPLVPLARCHRETGSALRWMTATLHPSAERHIEESAAFYERDGSSVLAASFVAEFKKLAKLLLEPPDMGLPRAAGRRGFSRSVVPYTVIYRASPDEIRVLVVKHDKKRAGFGGTRT